MVALMDEEEQRKVQKGRGSSSKPISCHLIEVDLLSNVLWTWSYPNCDNDLKLVCLRKFNTLRRRSSGKPGEIFSYFRYRKSWFYVFISRPLSSYDGKAGSLEKLEHVGVVVEAEDFNTDRYQLVNEILFRTYFKQEDPTIVLQQFLSLIVTGTCQLPKKKLFSSADYDTETPFTDYQIKTIISKFGLETIVLLTALVRQLKIVIYHHDIDVLVQYALSIPTLTSEAPTYDNVYPWVGYNDEELAQFSQSKHHIIGCPNANIENRGDLFDVFVNVPAGEVSVASHAKEKMMMSKPHKEMALFLVQIAENNDIADSDMAAEIRSKIKELSINNSTTTTVKKYTADV